LLVVVAWPFLCIRTLRLVRSSACSLARRSNVY